MVKSITADVDDGDKRNSEGEIGGRYSREAGTHCEVNKKERNDNGQLVLTASLLAWCA